MSEPAITRKYSLAEIDEMRELFISMFRTQQGSWSEGEDRNYAEQHLRTAMMAGIDVQEVRDTHKVVLVEFKERRERLAALML